MGTFRELQNLAIKEVKFKQSKVLSSDTAFLACALDQQAYARAREGVCGALAMAYLKDVLSASPIEGPLVNIAAGEMTRFRRNHGMSSSNVDDQQIAAAVIPNQAQLRASWEADWKKAVQTLGTQLSLKANVLFTPSLDGTFLKGWTDRMTNSSALWVKYKLQTGTTTASHAVAVFKSSQGIHFFDPNIGGYRIQPANFDAFIEKYLELLEKNFKWRYISGEVVFVSK